MRRVASSVLPSHGNFAGRCAIPALGGAGSAALVSLPDLPLGVSTEFRPCSNPKVWGELGLSLLDAGLLDVAGGDSDLRVCILTSLNMWLDKSWGGFKWFDFSATLVESFVAAVDQCFGNYSSYDGNEEELAAVFEKGYPVPETGSGKVVLCVGAVRRFDLVVGAGLRRLEEAHPGLGESLLGAIESTGAPYGLRGINWLVWKTKETQWWGGEDEDELVDSWGEDEDGYQGITRAELDEAIPKWAQGSNVTLSRKALLEIAEEGKYEESKEAARLLIAWLGGRKGMPAFDVGPIHEAFDGCHVEEGEDMTVRLLFADDALTRQVTDDWYQGLMEGDAVVVDVFGFIPIPLGCKEFFKAQPGRWARAARQLGLVDRMLSLIATETGYASD